MMSFEAVDFDQQWDRLRNVVDMYAEYLVDQERDSAMAEEVAEGIDRQTANGSTVGSRPLWQSVPKCASIAATAASLLVSTAKAERLFSKIEKTLTAIRSTVDEQRLEARLMLQVHRSGHNIHRRCD